MLKDFIIDENNDLAINGDLIVADSELQHQKLLLITDKGDWKESPTVGVGLASWLKDDERDGLLAEIKKEFEKDGMKVKQVDLSDTGKLDINANY